MADVTPNPNPALITNEMWAFWLAFLALEPTVKLGGIYANKKGYHNTRNANMANWPGNYSYAQFAVDREGPGDKSAAIDLTFPDAQSARYATINKYSQRLRAAGQDPNDERTNYLREFFGQTDGDSEVEGWDFAKKTASSSDSSHLWHIHISIHRKYVASPKAFRALLSILRGETVAAWRAAEAALAGGSPVPTPPPPAPHTDWTTKVIMALPNIKRGSKGQIAKNAQALLNTHGASLKEDGDFAGLSHNATVAFQRSRSLAADGIIGPQTWTALLK